MDSNTSKDETLSVSDSSKENEIRLSLMRKKLKEIIFLYNALLTGWKVHMCKDGKFHFSRES
jgi:hypothetical protein